MNRNTTFRRQIVLILGYQHFTVNHKYHFVDPTTKVHTQHIERLWGSVKWRNKKERGTKRDFIETYLAEFMCRKCLMGEEPFDWVMKEIALQYPPQINAESDGSVDENEENNGESNVELGGDEMGDVAEYDTD